MGKTWGKSHHMCRSNGVSNKKVLTGSSLFAARRGSVIEPVEQVERRENKVLDDSRAHLCFSVVVAEVQALKAEVGILKQSFEEERRAHKASDLQLQKVLELEKIRERK